uniref:Uncharacterized protein n=1 Tax=viral metagenome TaxID=1070528 RepID=A0A6H1ZL49_9ZZZZ
MVVATIYPTEALQFELVLSPVSSAEQWATFQSMVRRSLQDRYLVMAVTNREHTEAAQGLYQCSWAAADVKSALEKMLKVGLRCGVVIDAVQAGSVFAKEVNELLKLIATQAQDALDFVQVVYDNRWDTKLRSAEPIATAIRQSAEGDVQHEAEEAAAKREPQASSEELAQDGGRQALSASDACVYLTGCALKGLLASGHHHEDVAGQAVKLANSALKLIEAGMSDPSFRESVKADLHRGARLSSGKIPR